MSTRRTRTTLLVASLLVVGALVALAFLPASAVAGEDVEIGIEDPGDLDEDDLPITVDLEATNVDTDEGIGAFQVNVTADNVEITDVSETGEFEIHWAERTDGVITIVGYTGETDPQGEETLTLAELTISGDATSDAELAVDEIIELVDPQDADAIDSAAAAPVTFDIEEDEDPPDPTPPPAPPDPPEDPPEPVVLDDDEIRDRVDVPDDVEPVRGEAAEIFERIATFSDQSDLRTITFDDDDVAGDVTAVQYETESDETGASPGRTLSVTQLSVPDPDRSATLSFTFSMDRLDAIDATPDELQINRYADGWTALETNVEVDDDEVQVTAHTPGFSWFSVSAVSEPEAVIDVDPEEPEVGQEVTFDGSASEPGEEEIVSFEWTIDGETYDGETVTHTFDEAGEYDVELTVENDGGKTDTATETVTVVDPVDYELTVEVVSEAGDSIANADVTVDGEQATTDADGTATFELPEGTYTVEADADGFEPASQEVTLDADETVTLTLADEDPEYELTVEVTNEDGDAIEGADVEVDGEQATTGEDGTAVFELPPGEYIIDVDADGYEPVSEDVDLDEDTTVTIEVVGIDDGIGLVGILLILIVLAAIAGGVAYYYLQQQE